VLAEVQTIISVESGVPHGVDLCPSWVLHFFEWLQAAADLIGMATVAVGFFGAVYMLLTGVIRRLRGDKCRAGGEIKAARMFLGKFILLGLELMIVSDVVHSFLKPDLDSLYALGLTVVIRTAISFFLGKELEAVKREEAITA
jgi:uncharacterized membrane protein